MKRTTTPATCTDAGKTEYTCTDCGYTYTSEFIGPKGHDFEKKRTDADCTHDGYTEYTCKCGFSYISDYISALGHTYEDTLIKPDCTHSGYTYHKCKLCGTSYTSAHTKPLGHIYTETVTKATCKESGTTVYTCDCGYSYTAVNAPPLGHTYQEKVISEADCTTPGEIKYTCACGESYSKILSPSGHDFSRLVTMPTLSDMGYTEYTCANCNFKYSGDLRFYSDILSNAYAGNSEAVANGIDISYHNYTKDGNGEYIPLDFKAIKDSGIDYVIIRIGYTSSVDGNFHLDETFELSYQDAKAAGLDVGAYFYTLAKDERQITEEANLILHALEGKQFEYPIYLDLEDPSYLNEKQDALSGIDAAQLSELCVTFFTVLQRSGYYTGLYVNHNWLYNLIQTDVALSRFEIWYAKYPSDGSTVWNTSVSGEHLGMWQYSDKGSFADVSDLPFDLNFAYKDYPTLIKEGGFNGYGSDVKFPDTGKSFVWVIHEGGQINVRSKPDYFITDDYDASLDVIGYAGKGDRFEVLERTENYTKIYFEYEGGQIAYISANPKYVSFSQ